MLKDYNSNDNRTKVQNSFNPATSLPQTVSQTPQAPTTASSAGNESGSTGSSGEAGASE